MILIGLLGVINCGEPLEAVPPANSNKLIGDSSNTPKNMFYSVISIS
jgi:hypothetical protein